MKFVTKFKMPTYEQTRDFIRNVYGRFQLFLVLIKWDRLYRREVIVTILAFALINYSILDMDTPYDWIALIIEALIMWIQLGNDYSILPREYRPSQNGVKFTVKTAQNITYDNETYGFDTILPPDAEKKLKMYNPFLGAGIHKETPLCSDSLNDHIMTAKNMPYIVTETPRDYISSVHQIRYLAIRVANKKQHTTNGEKLGLSTSADALMSKAAVPVCKTTYFEALLTAEAYRSRIYRQNLRGVDEINTDLTQYYPVKDVTVKGEKALRLIDNYYERTAGHIGATSILFTENKRILMLFQGAGKALEANKIHLGGSGSMDFDDISGTSDEDLRDAVRKCMARETVEEAGLPQYYNQAFENTKVIGFFHWMDRSAKPEFSGITKAGDVPFAEKCNLDGDEIVKAEEIPITINKLSDFNKVLDYTVKNKLNLSLSSLMTLHRMTVIAGYKGGDATKKQKAIYKEMSDFLFA